MTDKGTEPASKSKKTVEGILRQEFTMSEYFIEIKVSEYCTEGMEMRQLFKGFKGKKIRITIEEVSA